MTAAADIPPPSALLALTELQRAMLDIASLGVARRWLERQPEGDGHPVMVLPGFMGSDGYNAPLRRYLTRRNYAAHGWGLGQNLGPRDGVLEGMQERLDAIAQRYGQPVSLVGHSLGGVYARELAREMPDRVRQVVSLGSPFGEGRMTAAYPSRLFAALNPSDELPIEEDVLAVAPPVPTTAVFSRGDGIVNWVTTRQDKRRSHPQVENIQVFASHCGLTMNPLVWYLLSDRLQQGADEWRPFERRSWHHLAFPDSD